VVAVCRLAVARRRVRTRRLASSQTRSLLNGPPPGKPIVGLNQNIELGALLS
jgi:hypothetical protein